MQQKSHFSLMLMYNKDMDNKMGAFRKGFTIVEVMLFLALSGLLLVGLLGGLGGNIARQRYNDAVQDVADIMRDQYSFVSDTQISQRENDSRCYGLVAADFDDEGNPSQYFKSKELTMSDYNSYRGRTNCVVYGAVVTINSNENGSYIETTELIGKDYETLKRDSDVNIDDRASDISILKGVLSANNVFVHCDSDSADSCHIRSANNSRIKYTKWGTKLLDTKGNTLEKTLLIFRSPRDGSIRTYVRDGVPKDNSGKAFTYNQLNATSNGRGMQYAPGTLKTYGINEFLEEPDPTLVDGEGFRIADLDICVDSGSGQTSNNIRRLVKVQRGGTGQSAVELINTDIEKSEIEGKSLGETKCE